MNDSAAPHPAAAPFSSQAERRAPITKLLIANRGEIACRVIRTAQRMGIATVAVYSDVDRGAPHVRQADSAARIGGALPSESYLNISAIIEAAQGCGADAVHPGYGFLSENADFAEACADAGMIFVGPPAEAIRVMGDKARAKALMEKAGVPVVPGYAGDDQLPDTLAQEAESIGYPLLIKAAAGGGGRGMRLVKHREDFAAALQSGRREAENAFGDGRVLIEKLVENARHIEIQVFAGTHGNCIQLGERDCSAQRRHQKIIEESPSPFVDDSLRAAMGADAVRAAQAIDYFGAGTVEFIVGEDRSYHFLEMNTRLQVEHPVTEMVTGFDLVEWQLRVAMGEPLPVSQDDVRLAGHAMEARLYAEDPYASFAPQTGKILYWRPQAAAALEGIRIDHGLAEGGAVTPFYDPMLAKVIAHGRTRKDAAARLDAALRETPLFGVKTNRRFLLDLVATLEFRDGAVTTDLIDRWAAEGAPILQSRQPEGAPELAAAILMQASGGDWFRSAGPAEVPVTLDCYGALHRLTVRVSHRHDLTVESEGGRQTFDELELDLPQVRYSGQQATALIDGRDLWLDMDGWTGKFTEPDPVAATPQSASDPSRIVSPVAGLVRSILATASDHVEAGQTIAVIEAMKMETALTAKAAGTVRSVHFTVGAQARAGDLIAEIDLEEADG